MTTIIEEDYVSFETAKLLKDKGFNEPCYCFYEYKKRLYNDMCKYFPNGMKNSDHDKEGNKGVSAPTLQMAMKWLRKIHNINIDIVSIWNQKQFEYQVFVVTPKNAKHCYVDDKLYLGYEEACEAAIKYCLDLI